MKTLSWLFGTRWALPFKTLDLTILPIPETLSSSPSMEIQQDTPRGISGQTTATPSCLGDDFQ